MRVSSWARAHALKADNAKRRERRTDAERGDGNVVVGVGVLEPATPAAAATSVFLSVDIGRAAGRRSQHHKRHRVLLAPLYILGRGVAYSGLRRVFVDREVDEVIVPGDD